MIFSYAVSSFFPTMYQGSDELTNTHLGFTQNACISYVGGK